MKHQYLSNSKRVAVLLILLFAFHFSANAQYTLTDDDIVMENGYIRSLTVHGKTNIQNKSIVIPETLLSQKVQLEMLLLDLLLLVIEFILNSMEQLRL